ncbi:unnamed protein product [Heterotrigona itama]|uniref:Uncharacterized protein n=1 Tax=Heterotrigona itama TaxID=395501 RepID=A0A6V7H7M2_9HYME|nr:unnamed protein product [Heterotrigona itama]
MNEIDNGINIEEFSLVLRLNIVEFVGYVLTYLKKTDLLTMLIFNTARYVKTLLFAFRRNFQMSHAAMLFYSCREISSILRVRLLQQCESASFKRWKPFKQRRKQACSENEWHMQREGAFGQLSLDARGFRTSVSAPRRREFYELRKIRKFGGRGADARHVPASRARQVNWSMRKIG